MATNYKWEIPQMNAHVQSEGESNVIYTVHYIYTASEEKEDKKYSSSVVGSQDFKYKAGDSFVPYEDTEAFEAVQFNQGMPMTSLNYARSINAWL